MVDKNNSPPIHQRRLAMGRAVIRGVSIRGTLIRVGCQDVLIAFDVCRRPESCSSALFHHREFRVEESSRILIQKNGGVGMGAQDRRWRQWSDRPLKTGFDSLSFSAIWHHGDDLFRAQYLVYGHRN